MEQLWGGNWTQQKLEILEKYLKTYMKIFTTNEGAKYFETIYIDAFAGCGKIYSESDEQLLFNDEFTEYSKGSVIKALELENKFNKYIFIENDSELCKELELEVKKYSVTYEIKKDDANKAVTDICHNYDWKKHRAVLFLDPFGMQVKWETIKAIAQTKAIDMWYFFPLGIGAMRLLKKDGEIEEGNRKKLNELFGDNEWEQEFYQIEEEETLFGKTENIGRTNYKNVITYLSRKLKKEFAGVVENPKIFYNSKSSPIYLLCFAAGNSKGAKTAIPIAQSLINIMEKRR
jgi:three-Cys-motif partner protein